MIDNIYKVSKKQWKKWNPQEQTLFNELHWYMIENQHLFKHPLGAAQVDKIWKTTAWNAAWMAADILREKRKSNQ